MPAGAHQGHAVLHHAEGGNQVDLQQLAQARHAQVVECRGVDHPGAGGQAIDAPAPLGDFGEHRSHCLFIAQVQGERPMAWAQRMQGAIQAAFVTVQARHLKTLPCQLQGGRRANTAGRTGDHRHPVLIGHEHCTP
ncbi:hypothetical protein D3C77_581230 [compost metagenome]